jgi:hypothetical protein
MKSPFPGMDPYLEPYWLEVHHSLITYTRDQMRDFLPEDLRARVEERVLIESDLERWGVRYPDVHVVEYPSKGISGSVAVALAESSVDVAEPINIDIRHEPISQGYIEIIDASSGNRVVTAIEYLSPSNKVSGEGKSLYLKKIKEYQEARVNFVVIDLTRAGQRQMIEPPEIIPLRARTTYQICEWRAEKADNLAVYRVPLSQRLPIIPIPLRPTDKDITLDLQELIDLCYHNGRYDNVNYRLPLDPPLPPEETAWMDGWLKEKGLR